MTGWVQRRLGVEEIQSRDTCNALSQITNATAGDEPAR